MLEEEWKTLPILNTSLVSVIDKSKSNTFYYKQGDRNITILSTKYKGGVFSLSNLAVWDSIIVAQYKDGTSWLPVTIKDDFTDILKTGSLSGGAISSQLGEYQNLKDWQFQIEYVPISGGKVKVVKQIL